MLQIELISVYSLAYQE